MTVPNTNDSGFSTRYAKPLNTDTRTGMEEASRERSLTSLPNSTVMVFLSKKLSIEVHQVSDSTHCGYQLPVHIGDAAHTLCACTANKRAGVIQQVAQHIKLL